MTPIPTAITRRDDGLVIRWADIDSDCVLAARAIRLACPCAECVEEMTSRPLLDPASVPSDVRPVAVSLVGAYGIRIRWSDGHGTGIYTFERLRSLSDLADAP
ncbi:MAG: DUF971 domain-containing protein [Gemmatimonadales bacterium]